MRNRIPTNVRSGLQAINARVAGYAVVPCVWSAETAVAKRAAFLTMDHEVRPKEAPLG